MRGRGVVVGHRLLVCHPTAIVEVSVVVAGSPSPLAEALELLVVGVMMSFAVKPPDIAPLEVGPKGAALLCSLWSAQLAVKNHGGTLRPLVPIVASQVRLSPGGA
jgi:hypothetical protein